MKTRLLIFTTILGLVLACSKDDGPVQQQPEPINQPDPEPENRPPGSFSLLTPEMDTRDISRMPIFSWEQATDPDGDPVRYDVYLLSGEVADSLIAEGLETTTYESEQLLDFDAEYHWRVVARDDNGATTESDGQTFVTEFPINYLKEYSTILANAKAVNSTQTFSYINEMLNSFEDRDGTRWSAQYAVEVGSGDSNLSTLRKEEIDGFQTFSYIFMDSRKQESVSSNDSSWDFTYDSNDRIIAMEYAFDRSTSRSERNDVTAFRYPNEETTKPNEITVKSSSSNSPDSEVVLVLNWEGENIKAIDFIVTSEDEPRSGRIEYSYDKNINPYYVILKEQFGLEPFFVLNTVTGMESIDLSEFGSILWQSKNNITKIVEFQNGVSQPVKTSTFVYQYSDDYYPVSAQGNVVTSTNEITNMYQWKY